MKSLLEIKNLSKHYDGFDLEGIDLTVEPGTVVGFIGSNGAGKTTTIKSALGLIEPDSGSVRLLWQDMGPKTPSVEVSSVKQHIGVVFDACAYPAELTVRQVGTIMKHAYREWDDATFKGFLDQFELSPTKQVKELSRGMGMKLSLACALSHRANLLILDEATAGLDPIARDEVLGILRGFMNEDDRGILMSSHITSDLEKIADYIVCIDEGRIAFSLEKEAITDQAGVAQCRTSEFEDVVQSGYFEPGAMHYVKHAHGYSVLVPDRVGFSREFGSIALERASIDDYMSLTLKGSIQ